ncbi:glycosyltransferase 87 family protein [Streptomyces sp. CA-111067]|uniref:glycosyltransferase 87 family protein n=1 Tax=Streptomyces sp. CA-111067 TaxID=3240046 RepID=UPI003D962E85
MGIRSITVIAQRRAATGPQEPGAPGKTPAPPPPKAEPPRNPGAAGETGTPREPGTPLATGAPPAPENAARRALPVLLLTLLLAGLVTVVIETLAVGGDFGHVYRLPYWYAAGWALFGAAVLVVRKVPRRAACWLIVAGSVALALAGLSTAPRTSDDMYRYAWDGKVQAAGFSPYAYPPDAPQLAGLREPWLFPPRSDPASRAGGDGCPGWDLRPVSATTCTRINRPTVHTIYPPVAEGWFLAVHALSPSGSRWKPMQAGGALLAVGTTGALLLALRRRRADPRGAAVWAWCPIVPIASVNDAHVDTLGVLLTVLAFGLTAGRARRGALLGAAIAVKLLPVLAMPAALARRAPREWPRIVLPAVAVIVLAYLPYVLRSGSGVLGYLPGYLQEEGYEAGSVRRFALLRLVLPDGAAGPAAMLSILAVAGYVLLRGDRRRPWGGALLVTGSALLLTSPAYYWYALIVVALVALDGRWEWLGVPLAGLAVYTGSRTELDADTLQTVAYGIAAALVIAGALVRGNRIGSTVDTPPEPVPY